MEVGFVELPEPRENRRKEQLFAHPAARSHDFGQVLLQGAWKPR
jgi:hypothetical protein